MKTLGCLLTSVFCLLSPAQARIGETREECVARYGPPDDFRGSLWANWVKPPFQFTAEFISNRCERITYVRGGGAFTPPDLQYFQSLNGTNTICDQRNRSTLVIRTRHWDVYQAEQKRWRENPRNRGF
jgi:hypothetical protein